MYNKAGCRNKPYICWLKTQGFKFGAKRIFRNIFEPDGIGTELSHSMFEIVKLEIDVMSLLAVWITVLSLVPRYLLYYSFLLNIFPCRWIKDLLPFDKMTTNLDIGISCFRFQFEFNEFSSKTSSQNFFTNPLRICEENQIFSQKLLWPSKQKAFNTFTFVNDLKYLRS